MCINIFLRFNTGKLALYKAGLFSEWFLKVGLVHPFTAI